MTSVQILVSCDQGDFTIVKESRLHRGDRDDSVAASELLDDAVAAVRRALLLPVPR